MAEEYSPVKIELERGQVTAYKQTCADGKVWYKLDIDNPLFKINEGMTSQSDSKLRIIVDEATYHHFQELAGEVRKVPTKRIVVSGKLEIDVKDAGTSC